MTTITDACPRCGCPTVADDVRERRPWRYMAFTCPYDGQMWSVAEAMRWGRGR